MSKKLIHKQTKKMLTLGISLALFFSLFLGGILFVLVQKQGVLEERVGEVREQETRAVRAQKERHVIAQTFGERLAVNTYLITEHEAVLLIEDLETFAQQTGVELLLQNVEATLRGGQDILAVSYTARGSWRNVFTFLAVSEVLPASTVIDRARLKKDEEGGGWTLDMAVSILGFNKEI